MAAPITLFCKFCETGYASTGEIPKVCPACQRRMEKTDWTTHVPWKPSHNDKRFLKSIRIASE